MGLGCKSQMSGFKKVRDLRPETISKRNGILALHNGVETHIQAEVIEVRRNAWEMDFLSSINQIPFLLPSLTVGTEYYPLTIFSPR